MLDDRATFLARLRAHEPESRPRDPADRRAAVAVVLREHADDLEVLLMTRTVHEGDRWSGQVSFPGGHADPGDADLVATARRETVEEVGVDLSERAQLLTRVRPFRAIARGRILPMTITPFVFLAEPTVEPTPGYEAQETFWLPLRPVLAGSLDSQHRYRKGPVTLQLPAWNYEGRTIWGLTHRMMRGVLAVATDRTEDL